MYSSDTLRRPPLCGQREGLISGRVERPEGILKWLLKRADGPGAAGLRLDGAYEATVGHVSEQADPPSPASVQCSSLKQG